jgi:hypothetical protein
MAQVGIKSLVPRSDSEAWSKSVFKVNIVKELMRLTEEFEEE